MTPRPAIHRSEPHVVIVGAGVIGVCCAYFLAKRGARVTVLERDAICQGASYGNAGSIAPGHTPINKPGRVKQALLSLFDPLSPLYVAPRPDPALIKWLWAFIRHCSEEHLEFSMRVMAPLGRASRQLFGELIEREKIACCFQPDGYYEIYLTSAAWQSAEKEARFIAGYGCKSEILSGAALRDREPAFNDRIQGGIFYPEAATLNPYRFVTELAKRAEKYGAIFRTAVEVAEILTRGNQITAVRTHGAESIEADRIVLAAGAYGAPLVRKLGLNLPLQAAKGYHRDQEIRPSASPFLRHACVLGENMVFCTPMDGFVRYAGTLEFSGVNHEIRRPRLEQLTRASKRYLHGVEDKDFCSEWCGLRPCLPDGLPALGPVDPYPGLFIATGHGMLGLTLGPITGKLMSESILDGSTSLDISAFRPGRF